MYDKAFTCLGVCAYTTCYSDRISGYFKFVGSECAFSKIFMMNIFLFQKTELKSSISKGNTKLPQWKELVLVGNILETNNLVKIHYLACDLFILSFLLKIIPMLFTTLWDSNLGS